MKRLRNIHPGEVLLEEFLKPMNLSQNRIARAIGVPPRRINEIVLGKRGITADTAIRLAKPGSPWSHWFYDPARGSERFRGWRERRLARSERRYTLGWSGRFERWFSDLVGGAPTITTSETEGRQAH